MESLITTELENAILAQELRYPKPAIVRADPVAEERELNLRAARRVLDVFYDVDREFIHIELGLV